MIYFSVSSARFITKLIRVMCMSIILAGSAQLIAQGTGYAKLDSMIALYESKDPDVAEIELLNDIALTFCQIDPAQAFNYAIAARELSLERGTRNDLADSYNSLGSSFLMMGEVDSAISYMATAKDIYTEVEDIRGSANVAGNMGHIFYYIGNLAAALEHYFEALWLFEELEHGPGIANQHASIGNVYQVQEKYQEAIHHDSIALEMMRTQNDQSGEAMVLGNLGNIYTEIDSINLAIDYYDQALSVFRVLNLPDGVGRNLVNIAGLYIDLGNFSEAYKYAQESYEVCSGYGFPVCAVYSMSNMGLAHLESYAYFDSTHTEVVLLEGYSKRQHLTEAINYLEQASDLPPDLTQIDNMDELHLALSRAYAYNGQFELALEQHQRAAAIKDSLDSESRAARIEELITEREIAVRDKQIELDRLKVQVKRNERAYFGVGAALLIGWLVFIYRNYSNQKKANTQLGVLNETISETNSKLEDKNEDLTLTLKELKETQEQLVESERQKENEILRSRISRDIHDDISSGLTKISWMAERMKAKSSTVDPAQLDKVAAYARDTVSKLGEIIWSTKPESDNVESLTSYMRDYLNSYLDGLDMKYEISFPKDEKNLNMNPELRRNLFLVLKESVHNAAKYSQAELLKVSFQVRDGRYYMSISDNGVGFDTTNESNGNGLKNMEARMKAVDGRVSVKSAPGEGTTISFNGEVY